MEIIRQNRNLSKQELYMLTMSAKSEKLASHKGEDIEIVDYVEYENMNSTGEIRRLLSFSDVNGTLYTTNSATFIATFEQAADIFEDLHEAGAVITVLEGKSNKGRSFIDCGISFKH